MRPFKTIGNKEALAAANVIGHRPLSGYIGSNPVGGHECSELELEWAKTFGVRHAVAVNSGTSGLLAACMAVGVTYGDEVIVSPYTMSATAAAPKLLGATIRFADIEPDTFTIDPVEVSNLITPRTKAVIATNLFGHPAHLRELMDICENNGVYLIEDNAQAIFARENGEYTGTIGHIGVFSLNVHKHLQVGEGGICVTNSTELDTKLRQAMNHGEMRGGIIGLNLRMTEVTAAMARAQLIKAPAIMDSRHRIAHEITFYAIQKSLPLEITRTREGCEHSYYCWSALLTNEPGGELPEPFKRGYLHPLYDLPAFRTKPSLSSPVVEDVERKIVLVEVCSIEPTDEEIVNMVEKLGRVL